jgi:hypothetical protein
MVQRSGNRKVSRDRKRESKPDVTAELLKFAKEVAEYSLECEDFYLAAKAENVVKQAEQSGS